MRGADNRERGTRLQGNTEGERKRFGGRFQRRWKYGAGQSGHFGVAANSVHTGADLFRNGRSSGSELVLLYVHGGARSLDANEWQRGNCNDGRGGSAERQLQSAGGVHRYYEPGFLVLRCSEFVDRKSTRLNSSHANISY